MYMFVFTMVIFNLLYTVANFIETKRKKSGANYMPLLIHSSLSVWGLTLLLTY